MRTHSRTRNAGDNASILNQLITAGFCVLTFPSQPLHFTLYGRHTRGALALTVTAVAHMRRAVFGKGVYLKLHVGLSELFCLLLQRHHPHFSLLSAPRRRRPVPFQKLPPALIRVLVHHPPAPSAAGRRRLQRLRGLHLLRCGRHLEHSQVWGGGGYSVAASG